MAIYRIQPRKQDVRLVEKANSLYASLYAPHQVTGFTIDGDIVSYSLPVNDRSRTAYRRKK